MKMPLFLKSIILTSPSMRNKNKRPQNLISLLDDSAFTLMLSYPSPLVFVLLN